MGRTRKPSKGAMDAQVAEKGSAKRSTRPQDDERVLRIAAEPFSATKIMAERKGRTGELEMRHRKLYKELIWEVRDFLRAEEATSWILYGENIGFERTFHKASRDYAHRDNGRIQFNSDRVAAALWERAKHFVPQELDGRKAVGCNRSIRMYRYDVGQSFGKHIDQSDTDEAGQVSQITLLLYLNGGSEDEEERLTGGETKFYKSWGDKEALSYEPKQGSALFHGHGDRCLLHEGAVVTSGTKYLLRTDVMYM